MSPRTTFQSCGSSSSESRRRTRPTFVIRGSPSSIAKPAPWRSAPTTIVRSLRRSKARSSPFTDGQTDPLKLAEIIVRKDVHGHELSDVLVYRGRPDSLGEPTAYSANLRQCRRWERSSAEVRVIVRALRYPAAWPREKAEEKGIDVALAIDFVMTAVRGDYDVGVVVSTDTDLKPALEAV